MTAPVKPRLRLEVHGHGYVAGGPRDLAHSHQGGDQPHGHPGTGPVQYTIDSAEWFATTGMKGGGRKVFTKAPSGPQLPYEARERPTYKIIIVGDGGASVARGGNGPGVALPERLRQRLGMVPSSIEHRPGPVPKRARRTR